MGFGTVAANMIFFIAILTIASGTIFYMNAYATETSHSMNVQQKRISDELRTNMNIDDASYNNETNVVTIYARNNGETNIRLAHVSVHVANERISSNNFSISIEEDTLIGSTETWQPQEVIKIQTTKHLENGNYHVKIVAPNGVSVTDKLIVG